MVIYDLCCAQGHSFEGWFESAQEHAQQSARGLVVCPHCGIAQVERVPVAPHALRSRGDSAPPPPADLPARMRELLHHVASAVRANSEDVGPAFAQEARRIHGGETPARSIRGTASAQEERDLIADHIPFVKVPMPEPDA
ncbi:MAG: DUF1178 family protein [Pseudomonadota bacterium]